MKRKTIFRNIMLLLLSFLIFTCTDVKAECSTQEKTNLIQVAYNLKFDYELLPNEGNNDRSFSLTISNFTKSIELRYGYSTYKYDQQSSNSEVVKMEEYFTGGNDYKFNIYASSNTNCKGEFLTSKTVTIPIFNSYSETEECQNLKDFKFCNRWYEKEITEKEFQTELKKYKESLKQEQIEKKENRVKTTLLDNIIKLYKKNITLSVVATIIIIILIIVTIMLIVKKNKKRIRIKIDI